MQEIEMKLQKRLAELRKKAGLSQQELADRLNISRQTVSKWEGGKGLPPIDMLMRLSSLYGVSVDYLLGRVDRPKEDTPEVESEAVKRKRWYLVAAVAAVLVLLVVLLLVKRAEAPSVNEETQYGELITEDVSGQEIDFFDFEW